MILSQTLLGGHGHHRRVEECDRCGERDARLAATLVKLQTCPRWQERDDAAHDLRDYDWRVHPEVVETLCYALLNDPEEEVREEAAETLAKLAPGLPVAHASLSRAAKCDRDLATRLWAKKALKALPDSCEGTCQVCGPEAIVGEPGLVGPLVDETVFPGLPIVPGKPVIGPNPGLMLDPGPESIAPLPPLESTVEPAPPPFAPSEPYRDATPLPPPPPSPAVPDDSLEPLPLEAPGQAARPKSNVKPAQHVEAKREKSKERKRGVARFLEIPAQLLKR